MIDMSAICSSTVPALFIVPMTTVSPCSMLRRTIRPSIGDSMRVRDSSYSRARDGGALLADALLLRAERLLGVAQVAPRAP